MSKKVKKSLNFAEIAHWGDVVVGLNYTNTQTCCCMLADARCRLVKVQLKAEINQSFFLLISILEWNQLAIFESKKKIAKESFFVFWSSNRKKSSKYRPIAFS